MIGITLNMLRNTYSGRILDSLHYCAEIQLGYDLKAHHTYRRWPTLSLYLDEANVLRHCNSQTEKLHFEIGDLGLYPFGVAEQVNWQGATKAIHLHFSPQTLITKKQSQTIPQVRRHAHLKDKYLSDAMLMLAELGAKNAATSREECDKVVGQIISHLSTFYLANKPKILTRLGYANLDLLIDQMHDHFAVENTVESLGRHTGLSSRRFRSNFSSIMGVPPYRYLTNSRLASAKFQVWCNQLSLTEIAYNTGFYDQSHFNRVFKAETGISPSNYRHRALY